ncbi:MULTISPECIES: hypothetical protein [Dactylosporangium]|uniref:Uncharacterized protein n=2 Tax=Dactylosporangium TaxID=35753 RepID=A0A9W6NSR8_9ACTN|nr:MULTISPECIES: hypothetical protein [Dactylosporangium]UAB95629.1 hypothetical protein Dvina_47785 [Dactylosporangium vinaceum]UWZ43987.1 hypothetical protein Dmats_42330 [Dactylosporangium matsuzakiense]GLL08665.1 hypothetical protein GCM10017581_104320 [Dactylosporangium matsuzakiense]
MVDPNGGPAGLYFEDDDDDAQDDAPATRLPIKKIAIVAGSVAGAALLISGIFYGPTVFRVLGQSDTEIKSPDKVGSFVLDKSDGAKNTSEYIRDAIASEVSLDNSVGLIYRDGGTDAILVAGTARIWQPDDVLSDAFSTVTDDSGGVKDARDVDAGPLGGTMRCGTTKVDESTLTVCGWVDNGSLGVALFSNRGVPESAQSMLALRSAVEHRN